MRKDCKTLEKNNANESRNVVEGIIDALILSINNPIESWILNLRYYFIVQPRRTLLVVILGKFTYVANDKILKIMRKVNKWNYQVGGHGSWRHGIYSASKKGKLSNLRSLDVVLSEDPFGAKKVSFSKIGKVPKVEKLELVLMEVREHRQLHPFEAH